MYELKEITVCIDYDLEVSVNFERQDPDSKWHTKTWIPTPTSWKRLVAVLNRRGLHEDISFRGQFDPLTMFVYIDVT